MAVKSQPTAISLSTEEQATWKDSPKNRDSISFEIDCCIPLSKSSDAYGAKKNLITVKSQVTATSLSTCTI